MLRKGVYIFTYRPIVRWERSLLVDNAYYGANYTLSDENKHALIHIQRRIENTLYANKEFNPKAVKDWYVYEYQHEINEVFPRTHTWVNFIIPNQPTFSSYLPDIISQGDVVMFETQEIPKLA
jgi:hypothetical protein